MVIKVILGGVLHMMAPCGGILHNCRKKNRCCSDCAVTAAANFAASASLHIAPVPYRRHDNFVILLVLVPYTRIHEFPPTPTPQKRQHLKEARSNIPRNQGPRRIHGFGGRRLFVYKILM
jgi:hypothetical protein